MTPSGLSDDFVDWASSQMRGLVDARHRDALAGQHDLPSFFALLDTVMNEYSSHAFARPDFVGNLDQPGSHSHTVDSLRERAMQFFLHNAAPGGVTQNAVPASPPLSTPSAQELWAVTDKQRLHALTCKALGIPTATNEADLPAAFTPQYNLLVRQEFDLLLEHERAQWRALARDHQLAVDRGEMDPTAVQHRQEALSAWIKRIIQMELNTGGLGTTMLVTLKGFFVGGEDCIIQTFRKQASTYVDAGIWHKSPEYAEYIKPHWQDFVESEVGDDTIFPLVMLGDEIGGDQLRRFRDELKGYCEELFRLQCGFDHLDAVTFWQDVAADPFAFVSRERLPDGAAFCNPEHMSEGNFHSVYDHIWCCHVDRKGVDPSKRFAYKSDAIAQYISHKSAHDLMVKQVERRTRMRLCAGSCTPGTGLHGSSSHSPADPIAVVAAGLSATSDAPIVADVMPAISAVAVPIAPTMANSATLTTVADAAPISLVSDDTIHVAPIVPDPLVPTARVSKAFIASAGPGPAPAVVPLGAHAAGNLLAPVPLAVIPAENDDGCSIYSRPERKRSCSFALTTSNARRCSTRNEQPAVSASKVSRRIVKQDVTTNLSRS